MRVAIVGMGMMGRLHARTMSSRADLELVGVETDSGAREVAAAELGIPVVTTLDEVVNDCDAVVITLPDHLHVADAIQALEAEKYVLVEKPLAGTTQECDRIIAADAGRNRLMVGHLLRFDERLRELRRRIVDGVLGELHYVRIHRSNLVTSGERLGGRVSVVGFLGVHDLDLLLWLTGQSVTAVSAQGRRVFTTTWDVVTASLELSGGTLAQVENHWLIHRASARSCLAGVEIFGSRGTALVDLSTDELELVTDDDPRSVRVDGHNWTHDPVVSGGSLHRQDMAFLAAVRSGGPVPTTGLDGRNAVAAVELVEASLRHR